MPDEPDGSVPIESGDPAADQPTVAIPPVAPADPAADQPTAAIPPIAPAGAGQVPEADEQDAAAGPEEADDTVAVVTNDAEALEKEDTETLEEETAAAPVLRPGASPHPAPGESPLTRRRLLLGLSGLTGIAAVSGAVVIHAAMNGSDEAKVRSLSTSPAITRPRTPEHTTVAVPPAPVQPRPIYTLAEYRKVTGAAPFPADAIALTIDDGPHPVWTPKILRLLDKYHVPAIFCMIGNQVLGHETVAQTVTRAGHQLANHTWSHPTHLSGKPKTLVQKEIHKAQTKIQKTTGYAPKLFRSPGGDWSPRLLHAVAQAGLLPLDWTVDPRDWSRPGVSTIEHRLLAAHPGQILLCHDGGGDRSQTYKSLSVVIPALQARGLHFAALQG